SAAFVQSFVPSVQAKKGEIHTVFPPFLAFRLNQNLWPNALAKLRGAASSNKELIQRQIQTTFAITTTGRHSTGRRKSASPSGGNAGQPCGAENTPSPASWVTTASCGRGMWSNSAPEPTACSA